MADKHPVYSQHYKFYAYIYRSKEKIERLADGFTQEATQLAHSMPSNRQMILITYSLGGVIVQESLLRNPKLLDRTQAIFAVTVPFHGSPFFNPIWFTEGLVPINYSPIRLFWDRLTYYVYMFDKANLPQGIRWDNFDQSQPDLDVRIPFDPTTVIQPGARLTVHERQIRSFKDKLIIYATYLNNRYTEPPKQRPLLEQVPLKLFNGIKEIPGAILPFYGFTAHSVMITGNHWLSNLPTFDPKTGNARNIHLFRYNDGVIPLSSQLYLQPRNVPYDNRIDELITAIDVYKARIFVNLDHIDIGEYRMPRSYTRAIDILNPAEGKRSPIEWILFDLQELMPQRPIARAQKVSLDHYILSPPSGLPRT
jgi:hypothetical protein